MTTMTGSAGAATWQPSSARYRPATRVRNGSRPMSTRSPTARSSTPRCMQSWNCALRRCVSGCPISWRRNDADRQHHAGWPCGNRRHANPCVAAVTDESDLLRRLIEDKLEEVLIGRPANTALNTRRIAEKVAEEVLADLRRLGAQVVRMHANGPRERE